MSSTLYAYYNDVIETELEEGRALLPPGTQMRIDFDTLEYTVDFMNNRMLGWERHREAPVVA